MALVTCGLCKESKDRSEFNRRLGGIQARCRACDKIINKRYHERNLEKVKLRKKTYRKNNVEKIERVDRKADYLKRYGITLVQYEQLLEEQKGVCLICSKVCASGRRLAVDHCHKSGIVRGLLCMACNTGLGKFNDDTDLMRKAIAYIESHRYPAKQVA